MNVRIWLLFLLGTVVGQAAEEITKLSLPLIPDLQRAEIYVSKESEYPVGVLVLSPGCNGNGKDWIQNPAWQHFAREHNLDLVGLSFASDVTLLNSGRGYYYPRQGSGQLLLDGLRQVYDRDLPLILYGFSGGAHFSARFAEWKPDRVIAWCSYSAAWWDKPFSNNINPPGLIACGEEDQRYGASLVYFKQGRALAKPWLWICASKTAHSIYPPVEDFARDYFAAVLDRKASAASGEWVDIDLKTKADRDMVSNQPSLTGWLPDVKLLSEWQELHQP